MKNLVTIQNNKAVTTSLQVAEIFGKDHAHILRDIRTLDCSPQFNKLNFELSSYQYKMPNGGQRKSPMFYMTKDGFAFLVMGFTGKKAGKFKEDYINAFNKMEAYIKSNTQTTHNPLEQKLSELESKYLNLLLQEKERTIQILLCKLGKEKPIGVSHLIESIDDLKLSNKLLEGKNKELEEENKHLRWERGYYKGRLGLPFDYNPFSQM